MISSTNPNDGAVAKSNEMLWTILIGVFLFLTGIMFAIFIYQMWPELVTTEKSSYYKIDSYILFGLFHIKITGELCLILLVILSSCLGSYVHVTTSFVTYVGNRSFKTSWIWWYILRILIGVALALIFYFSLRGGLLTSQSSDQFINPFGIAGISGIVGLFSKQATEKLREVFDTLFSVKDQGAEVLKDKLTEAKDNLPTP
jgi:magnesium-transporting ATPase (P-type)